MPGVRVGRGSVVRHAILDKNVVVGPGEMVGVDLEKDRERFAISAGGVVAVGKGVSALATRRTEPGGSAPAVHTRGSR